MATWLGFFSLQLRDQARRSVLLMLFYLAEEVLSRATFHLVFLLRKYFLWSFLKVCSFPLMFYFLMIFLFFCRINNKILSYFIKFLNFYCSSSRQHINYSKSNFFSSDDSINFIRRVNFIRKCSYETIPFVYLGVPIFIGAPKS